MGTPTLPVLLVLTIGGLLAGPCAPLILAVRLTTLPYRRQVRGLDLFYREISQWVLTRGLSGVSMLFAIISIIWLVPSGYSRSTFAAPGTDPLHHGSDGSLRRNRGRWSTTSAAMDVRRQGRSKLPVRCIRCHRNHDFFSECSQ